MQGILAAAAPQLRKILLGSVENEAKLLNTPLRKAAIRIQLLIRDF
jgi:hypothetical protein